jgi:hypothetical protein
MQLTVVLDGVLELGRRVAHGREVRLGNRSRSKVASAALANDHGVVEKLEHSLARLVDNNDDADVLGLDVLQNELHGEASTEIVETAGGFK